MLTAIFDSKSSSRVPFQAPLHELDFTVRHCPVLIPQASFERTHCVQLRPLSRLRATKSFKSLGRRLSDLLDKGLHQEGSGVDCWGSHRVSCKAREWALSEV